MLNFENQIFMSKKIFLVLSIAILSVTFVKSQVDFGGRVGLTLSNMKITEDYFPLNTKMKPGIQFGLICDANLLDVFAIQTGLLFTQQGFIFEDKNGLTSKISLNYFQIPVNAVHKSDLEFAQLFLQAGPYLGYYINGFETITNSQRIAYASLGVSGIKALDFGLGFGASVRFTSVQVGIGYNLGIMNLSIKKNASKLKNYGLAITLTFMFKK